MIWLNRAAGLAGASALLLLAWAAHSGTPVDPGDEDHLRLAVVIQMVASAVAFIAASRNTRTSLIGGWALLIGALGFTLGMFADALGGSAFVMATPLGSLLFVAGWLILGFSKPRV